MRLRKIEMDWGKGKVSLDLRGEGGHPLPICGLVGANGSGKSMLMKAALRLFRSSTRDNICFLDWDNVSATVEFDVGSGICTGIIKNGKIVQRLTYPDMKLDERGASGAMLFYDNHARCIGTRDRVNSESFAEGMVRVTLSDLYLREIRNSVIWIDDFALGLSSSTAQEFLNVLINKSLERDNQLIVSGLDEIGMTGIGTENIRRLGGGTNVIEEVLRTLK